MSTESQDDREAVIKLTCALNDLSEHVGKLHRDLENLKSERTRELVTTAVLAEKVDRLSWAVYGVIGVVVAQAVTVFGSLLFWRITQ